MLTFNVVEILEIAQQIERNGQAFYTRASGGSRSPQQRKLLENLASMERDHERTFAAMQARLGSATRCSETLAPEVSSYLRAIVEGKVFSPKPDMDTLGSAGIEEVLKTAIDLEKDSIVFYLGIEQLVMDAHDVKTVDEIIHEELGHVAILSDTLHEVQAGGDE
ncbi:MAG: ferritin family protein [Planctomycetaceae bacterium]|nr:ferritin family protein [Planctomycetaceae bacterium]